MNYKEKINNIVQGSKFRNLRSIHELLMLIKNLKRQPTYEKQLITYIEQSVSMLYNNATTSTINYLLSKLKNEHIISIDKNYNNKEQQKKQASILSLQELSSGMEIIRFSNCCCVGCRTQFIKQFPIYNESLKKTQNSFIILIYDDIFQKNIQFSRSNQLVTNICGLANQGGGSILLVNQYNKQNTNLILRGIKPIKINQSNQIQNKIKKAVSYVFQNEYLQVNVESVPLKELRDQKIENSEFILKINILVNPQKRRQPFTINERSNNKEGSYKIYKFVNIQRNTQWVLAQIRNNYIQLVNLALFNKKNIKILCKHKINFKGGVTSIINEKYLNKIDQQLKIDVSDERIFLQIINYCKKNNFQDDFPSVNKNQIIVFFQFPQNLNKQKLIKIIIDLFNSTKTKYKYLKPFKHLQQVLARQKKKQSPNTLTYQAQYFVFQGKYNNFKEKLKEKAKQENFKEGYHFQLIVEKFQTSQTMNQSQIDQLNELVKQKFKIGKLKFKKAAAFTETNHLKTYKNVQINVPVQNLNVAIYTYIILFLGKKRPKSDN